MEDNDDEERLKVRVDSERQADEETMQEYTELERKDPHHLRQHAVRHLCMRMSMSMSIAAS